MTPKCPRFWLEWRLHFALKKGIVNWSVQSLVGKEPFIRPLMSQSPQSVAARLDAMVSRYLQLLGQYINERRCQLHMSQEQLARASGLSRTEIHKIEHGRTSEQVATMVRVCHGLRIAYGELVAHMDFVMAHPEFAPPCVALKTRRKTKR